MKEPESLGNCVVARRGGKEAAGRILGSKNMNHIRPQYLGESARHDEFLFLEGRFGHFRLMETRSVLTKLQSWIQRKLRCYRIKQLGRASEIFWELKRLAVPAKELVWLVSTSRGPWRLSRNSQVHQGFGPAYWVNLGLFHLPRSWHKLASTT